MNLQILPYKYVGKDKVFAEPVESIESINKLGVTAFLKSLLTPEFQYLEFRLAGKKIGYCEFLNKISKS